MTLLTLLTLIIFIGTFILISLELINKTVTVLIGAAVFLFMGVMTQEQAFGEIDWNVVFLLIGMMIIVGITKKSGLFQYLAIKAAKAAGGSPVKILILLSLLTAVFSALLDNVTTVLILTPVSILIAVELGVSPLPFVITNALASNIGGTATLIGDPPNLMIGSAVGFSFMDFVVALGPVVLINLIVLNLFTFLVFRKQLNVSLERRARIMEFDEKLSIEDPALLKKSLAVLFMVITGFLVHGTFHLEPATIALAGAALLMLLAGNEEVDEYFHDVEWGTIFFFIGLFMMVGGLVHTGILSKAAQLVLQITSGNIAKTSIVMVWFSGLFSAFVDNIPYVATMIPLVENMGHVLGSDAILPVWWSLALGSCLGGNGTLIGASANVVSCGISGKSGYKISFLEFTKYGAGITFITLIISSAYIYLRFL
ncbi:MAG: ArsB/NhaD family transporter [Spirochaetales bacterium]|nr:ArsB/NhaD family transporter [Spirochaetales bacterium]